MNHHYSDIRDKLGEPLWFDEHAVPRYCEFGPRKTANIYARECVLMLIECQDCGREFKVAMSDSPMSAVRLSEQVADLHYGDPPNVECCAAGPTMNSVPRRVLEFWRYSKAGAWDMERVPELEVEINCEWAEHG